MHCKLFRSASDSRCHRTSRSFRSVAIAMLCRLCKYLPICHHSVSPPSVFLSICAQQLNTHPSHSTQSRQTDRQTGVGRVIMIIQLGYIRLCPSRRPVPLCAPLPPLTPAPPHSVVTPPPLPGMCPGMITVPSPSPLMHFSVLTRYAHWNPESSPSSVTVQNTRFGTLVHGGSGTPRQWRSGTLVQWRSETDTVTEQWRWSGVVSWPIRSRELNGWMELMPRKSNPGL